MARCKLCEEGDPGTNVMCWDCRTVFHIHRSQYGRVPEGAFIMTDCPNCGIVNCFKMGIEGITYSGSVLYYGQPIIDMREKR